MPSTASVVAWPPCAAGTWWAPAERKMAHENAVSASAAAIQILGFKVCTWADRWPFSAELILAHKKRCTDGMERFGARRCEASLSDGSRRGEPRGRRFSA